MERQEIINGLVDILKTVRTIDPAKLENITEDTDFIADFTQCLHWRYEGHPSTEAINTYLKEFEIPQAFLQQYFSLQPLPEQSGECVQLTPLQAPLTNFYRHIVLCGQMSLSRIELTELAGNRSEILLTAVSIKAAQ